MTEKRFKYGFVCGDKGLVSPTGEWLVGKVNSVTNLEENWDTVLEVLNEQHEELGNRKRIIKAITNEYNELEQAKNSLLKENEQLKQLNIPVDEIQETVRDYKGRIIGVYYND